MYITCTRSIYYILYTVYNILYTMDIHVRSISIGRVYLV